MVGFDGTEYIELLEIAGINLDDCPTCQAIGQHKIWNKIDLNNVNQEVVAKTIEELRTIDYQFYMDGASWTDNLSLVNDYENVLEPMNQLSADFHREFNF